MTNNEDIICRVCLTTITTDYDYIFVHHKVKSFNSSGAHKLQLSESGILYSNLFNLKISQYDNLPIYVCNYCTLQMKLFYKFKTKAIESYKILKQLNIKNEEGNIGEIYNDYDDSNVLDDECFSGKRFKREVDDGYELNTPSVSSSSSEKASQNNKNDITENIEIVEVPSCRDNDNMYLDESKIKSEIVAIDETDEELEDPIGDENQEEFEEIQYLEEEQIDLKSLRNDIDNSLKIEDEANLHRTLLETTKGAINGDNNSEEDDNYTLEFKAHICRHCNQSFKTKHQLYRHRTKVHHRIRRPCSQCKKSFYSQEGLDTHLRVHSGLPAYQCSECPKTFNQKAHFDYHMKGHRNERDVQCHLCGKGFITNSDLRIHLRVHNDERRYACDICGRRFRAHTHMTNHRYSHYDEKLECDICHQKYSCPNVLRTHIKSVHLGESPYQCESCNRRFKRKHHLKAHYKTHLRAGRQFVDNVILEM